MSGSGRLSLRSRLLVLLIAVTAAFLLIMGGVTTLVLTRRLTGQFNADLVATAARNPQTLAGNTNGYLAAAISRHLGDLRRAVQVVGGEVRPEIGAVAEARAVLHQALAQEQLLPGDHVRTGVDDLSGGRQDPPSDRRVRRVSAIPEKAQDRQTTQQDQSRDLHPHPGNQAATPRLDPRLRHGGSHKRAPRRSIKGKRW